MKKKALKVIVGSTLMIAIAVSIQVNKTKSNSPLMMKNLDAIAVADGEISWSGLCAHISQRWCEYDDGYRVRGTFRTGM